VVFLLSLALKKSVKLSNALLIVASLVFYAWGEPVYVLLMVVTTLFNYLAALCMGGSKKLKKLMLALVIVWDIGSLVLFKYTNLLVDTFNSVAGTSFALPQIALPIGISFFTFQALSYVIDVYRADARVNRNFFDILLFISLFPQLTAGPIIKYQDLEAQIRSRTLTAEKTAQGLRRFCFGLAKKALIANTLALVADKIFSLEAASVNAPIAWVGAISYMLQIYFDFSGYSDMAIGLGRVFGFEFKENFNYPYIALSMQDFWRRWHISLSTWFKLYVYIPLGGNRKGKVRAGINKMIVFLLTGLWHGASWSFALWGVYHGAFLMAESLGVLKTDRWPKLLRRIYVLLAVMLGFVLFRADSLAQAWLIISNMFAGWTFTATHVALLSSIVTPIVAITFAIAAFASTPFMHNKGERLSRKRPVWQGVIYTCAIVVFILSALNLSTAAYNPFIYFRF